MDRVFEAQARDLRDLRERRRDLAIPWVLDARFERPENRRLRLLAYADHERKAKAFAIAFIGRIEAGRLGGRELIESRSGLFAARRRREPSFAGHAGGEVGGRRDQRAV